MAQHRAILLSAMAAGLSWFAPALPAQEEKLPRAEWNAPVVDVSHADGKWLIKGQKQEVTLNESDLALSIKAGPATWQMVPSSKSDMLVKAGGTEFPVRLADAKKIEIAPYDTGAKTGVKIALGQWPPGGPQANTIPLDLTLYLTVCLEGKDEDLVFDVVAREGDAVMRRLDWPTALDAKEVDCTLLPDRRGILLPREYDKPYHPIRASNPDGSIKVDDTSEVQSNVIECWSMSWWGFQKGKSAMMVIVETPNDAAYQFSHPAGGPTVIGPRWRHSLGKLDYPRTARMCFVAEGNYVDLAKRYRRYAKETGLFVSLEEKIARKPIVKDLIGTPLSRIGILTNIKRGSKRFDKENPDRNYRLTTFEERAQQFEGMKERGLERLTVVLTGWPRLGYDRQHPDELPPATDAGGWRGMKLLADKCRELGYIFSLHDQYRDYYLDAPSYDRQFAVHEEDESSPPIAFPGTRFGQRKDGAIPILDHWDGGAQAYLNPRLMLGHLKKNYEGLIEHGIRPQGTYLDVFGYVPPDEDYNAENPVTRTESLKERALCYQWSREHLGFVGTEAACDWTVQYCDISSPLGQPKGIPVPLFNLVYHDAIMTTYNPSDLRGFINAGVPQIGGRQQAGEAASAAMRRMGALHERVALMELTNHEFLDKNYRKERSTFEDGTTVTVDWDVKTVEIGLEIK